jgi:hypothetical protein
VTKKDTPSRRLAEAIKYENWWRTWRGSLFDLGKMWEHDPVPGMEADRAYARRLHRLSHKNDEDDNSLLADVALQIDGAPAPLRRAFEAFGFDPNDPWSWRQLLIILADTHFREKGVGKPKEYDDLQLIDDYATMREKHPDQSDTAIFGYMIKRGACQNRYPCVNVEALKKRLDRAMKPYVEKGIARSLPRARAEAERAGKPWTQEAQAEARKRIRAAVKSGICEGVMRHSTRQVGDKTHP